MHELLLPIRAYELDVAHRYIPPGTGVVELGAGNGWQARALADLGHDVRAFDVDHSQSREQQFWDVEIYDGVHLPLADASVDVVYSSNVLEHVVDLPGLLAETRRVLKPSGRAVHVLPSPVWRAWTIAARYVFLAQLATRRRSLPSLGEPPVDAWAVSRDESASGGKLGVVRKALVEKPHGEFPSSLSELHHYRAAVWSGVFRQAGFRILARHPVGLFYTGYGIAPFVSLPQRRALAAAFGSACTVYVLENR